MARKVVVTMIDDFDGISVAEDTVVFELDGAAYEIDLSSANATKLREAFAQWLPHARRVGRHKPAARRAEANRPAGKSARRNDLTAVREWASKHGHTVSARGRIAADIMDAYEKASA